MSSSTVLEGLSGGAGTLRVAPCGGWGGKSAVDEGVEGEGMTKR